MQRASKLNSYEIKQCLQKNPLNKNVSKYHADSMRRKVESTIPFITTFDPSDNFNKYATPQT